MPDDVSLSANTPDAQRIDSLDQQIRFAEQRISALEKKVLLLEHELVDLDQQVETSRGTGQNEAHVRDRSAKAKERLELLADIAAEKQELDLHKTKRDATR